MGKIYPNKPPLGSQINWGHPLSKGIVGCWLMNEGGGLKTKDLIKNNNGALTGATWSSSLRGNSINCDTAQYVDFGNPSIFSGLTQLSVTFTFQINALANNRILSKWGGSNTKQCLLVALTDTDEIFWVVGSGEGQYQQWKTSTANLVVGKPYTITCTYLAPLIRSVYINGVSYALTSVVNNNVNSLPIGTTNLQYGKETDETAAGVNSKVINLMFHNRVLSPSEIQSLYVSPYQFISRPSSRVYSIGGGTAALTGTVTTATEADIVTGGKTIILTLTGDTWVATVGEDNAITDALIAGLDSAQSEANGWDAVVKTGLAYTDIVRTSDTVVTITLPAFATYDITATETITATIPASALTGAAQIVASPTFNVTAVSSGVVPLRCLMGVGI